MVSEKFPGNGNFSGWFGEPTACALSAARRAVWPGWCSADLPATKALVQVAAFLDDVVLELG